MSEKKVVYPRGLGLPSGADVPDEHEALPEQSLELFWVYSHCSHYHLRHSLYCGSALSIWSGANPTQWDVVGRFSYPRADRTDARLTCPQHLVQTLLNVRSKTPKLIQVPLSEIAVHPNRGLSCRLESMGIETWWFESEKQPAHRVSP